MSSYEIQLDGVDLEQEFTAAVDGVEYLFRLDWNERNSTWSLSLYDVDETPLALGIVLVGGWPLLRREIDTRLPRGEFYIVDTTGKHENPTRDGLGGRWRLMYLTADGEV